MPGARSRVNPLSAGELFSASDEISHLEQYLQRQLEDDVARIFDESIYSDLEVVSGKLKILTHSCILKARTHKFYHKLEAILHVDIGRNAFDEIYSFISDAYTECDIKHQEKEIISYLNKNLHLIKPETHAKTNKTHLDESELPPNSSYTVVTKIKTKEFDESDVFSTPSCVSPEESPLHKTLTSSPSTELTKEYYALVPIEGNILDKELIEQDALSSAFKSFIKSQGDVNGKEIKQCVKPTSLLLTSHLSKTNKHSTICDIEKEIECNTITNVSNRPKINNNITSQVRKPNQFAEVERYYNSSCVEKTQESAFSPDSLITDEQSSSSDYLSAAYTTSPGAASSGCFSQLNISENTTKMENIQYSSINTASDSGLENTGMMESINSHKDVTLTDLSLTESTFHDIQSDETNNSFDASSPSELKQLQKLKICSQQVSQTGATASQTDLGERKFNNPMSVTDTCGTSSKEEKQKQNEEIVILESSSLSSETGSWESVFPPKAPVNDLCQKFINHERQTSSGVDLKSCSSRTNTINQTPINPVSDLCPSLVQKSPFKSSSCFIDAASLADEGDAIISVNLESNAIGISCNVAHKALKDDSPNDCSEENDNEDSLEQADKELDSIQKDDSPVMFEMTPITEDSLITNAYENAPVTSDLHLASFDNASINLNKSHLVGENEKTTKIIFQTSTPNNSIITVGPQEFCNSKEGDTDVNTPKHDNERIRKSYIEPTEKVNEDYHKFRKHSNESPIISGGASVEDHLPCVGSYSSSPMSKRKIENIPIVSGAYIPDKEKTEKTVKAVTNAHSWVVDMSKNNESENHVTPNANTNSKQVLKPCFLLKDTLKSTSNSETSKSRSSVESDSSEKSTHKFYIDLSTLPDAKPPDQNRDEDSNEKKNIFSMFIDLGDNSTAVKEMPARLSSSLTKKSIKIDSKTTNKSTKTVKSSSSVNKVAMDTSNVELQNSTFEKLESLCNDPNISISDIIKKPEHKSVDLNCKHYKEIEVLNYQNSQKQFATTIIEEESVQTNTGDLFVRLSDLDKPVLKTEKDFMPDIGKLSIRMTRSIPENNWPESSQASNSRSVDIISSFHSENALSLNRLFPHLKNDFSKSMPGSLSSRTRSPFRLGVSSSPGDVDEQPSDASEISSVQSSMCRSVVENSTTEETSQTSSLFRNCQSRLGQDLLRMFIEEIAPDVIVEVQGRRIKAHKCILSSRCQYFAGILSGGWVESAGDVIPLPPFSFGVVHFALCHIYSGVSNIPDSISIVELATIADMLSLEGLKEAIMFTLKAKYCHHFHKPCPVCTAGVLECFPLSSVYGLDDLYRKCLRWITKYFHKVWPTKAFATLPSELLDKCYQEHIINLTTENFVETVYGCGMTMSSLSTSRWAEVVGRMCRRLVNAAAQFAAPRLTATLRCMASLPAEAPESARDALRHCLAAALEWAPPDEACRSYALLSRVTRVNHRSKPDLITDQAHATEYEDLLMNHAHAWRSQCEGALVRAAPRVVHTQAFKDLPTDLRKRLRELGCIVFGPVTPPTSHRKTRNVSTAKQESTRSHGIDIDRVRASFVPYAPKPKHVTAVDAIAVPDQKPGKIKSNPPKVRSTKAQEERAKFNMTKTVQPAVTTAVERVTSKPRSYENAKPRYLEPKVNRERVGPTRPAPVPRLVSSSESSRNSSPVAARVRRSAAPKRSQDSLAASSRPRTADPSTDSLATDSLNTDKYATYTKVKRTTDGSVESIQSSRCYKQVAPTKIPVYLKQSTKTVPAPVILKGTKKPKSSSEKVTENGSLSQLRVRTTCERKVSGSLMNATKSSSAKIVNKVSREHNQKVVNQEKGRSNKQAHEIPIMERSGTFLKDEPEFGDRTTNLHIDQ